MSQIGSTSGVRVAAQPLSNIYTALLLVAVVALVVATVLVAVTMSRNYGVVLPVSAQAKATRDLPKKVAKEQASRLEELKAMDESLKRFPAGAVAPGPGPTPTGPAATPPAPATPAPEPAPSGGAPGAGTAPPSGGAPAPATPPASEAAPTAPGT